MRRPADIFFRPLSPGQRPAVRRNKTVCPVRRRNLCKSCRTGAGVVQTKLTRPPAALAPAAGAQRQGGPSVKHRPLVGRTTLTCHVTGAAEPIRRIWLQNERLSRRFHWASQGLGRISFPDHFHRLPLGYRSARVETAVKVTTSASSSRSRSAADAVRGSSAEQPPAPRPLGSRLNTGATKKMINISKNVKPSPKEKRQ